MGMTYWKCLLVLLVSAGATILGSAATYSQTATPSTTVAPAPVTAAAPATIDRKKALEFGFRPQVVKGAAVFCKDEPIEGTRFKTTRCIGADRFADYLTKLQAARDSIAKNGCSNSGWCGNVGGMPDRPRMGMGMSGSR